MWASAWRPSPRMARRAAPARARASVAAALAAAVRMAVTSPASARQTGAPSSPSKSTTSPSWLFRPRPSAKTETSLAPKTAGRSRAAGMMAKVRPSPSPMKLRRSWRTSPEESAAMAWRTTGMAAS